ncbi:hypothetical protein, partial [Streptosporangium sandarakinum]
MATLKARVSRLEEEFMLLSSECGKTASGRAYDALTPVYTKLDVMGKCLEGVERRVIGLGFGMTRLDEKVLNLRIEAEKLDTKVSELDTKVTGLGVSVSNLGARVLALDVKVSEVDVKVEQLRDEMRARFAGVDERMDGLDS